MKYLLILSLFICNLAYAKTYEKVDDSTVKIIESVEQTVSIDELKSDLKVWKDQLDAENANHTLEVARLQAGIDERKEKILEAKKVGIKDMLQLF